jgi:cell division protein FtsB
MAAGAPARALPAPDRRETQRRPVDAPQRRTSVARKPQRRRQPIMARLVVFGVLLAMLSVGRVALSFAVVQKNLQTDAITRQYRAVYAQNQQLGETAASLSSALAIRNTAMNRYHLIVPSDVQFVTAHVGLAGKHANR